MKIELHLHTLRYSGCAVNTAVELLTAMSAAGYGATFITEHMAVWTEDELDELRERFPGLLIFPGVEITTGRQQGEHLLVLGTSDQEYLRIGEAGRIVERARSLKHLTILCHPCRWPNGHDMLSVGVRPDALEQYTCNHEGRFADESAELGRSLGLPVVNAGDVHSLAMINRYWIEIDSPVAGPADVRAAVLSGAYRNVSARAD